MWHVQLVMCFNKDMIDIAAKLLRLHHAAIGPITGKTSSTKPEVQNTLQRC